MSDMRKYAASFILDMRGRTDTVDAVIEKLSTIVTDLGGQVSSVENFGQKNFERVADRKFTGGIYIQMMVEGIPTIVDGIRSKLRLDKTVNRILIESVGKNHAVVQ
jgi:small subunit ribosomal protein S6